MLLSLIPLKNRWMKKSNAGSELSTSITAYLNRISISALYANLILFGIKPSKSLISKNILDSNEIPPHGIPWIGRYFNSLKIALAIAINEKFSSRRVQILINLGYYLGYRTYLLHPAFIRLALFESNKESAALRYIRKEWKQRFEVEKIQFKSRESIQLKDVLVDTSGMIWSETRKTFYFSDETSNPSNPFVAGQWDKVAGYANSKYAFIRESVLKNQYKLGSRPKYLDIRVRASNNYWHSLMVGGPKLLSAIKDYSQDVDASILASDEVPSSTKEAYELIAGDRKIEYLKSGFNLKVKTLIPIQEETLVYDACIHKPEQNATFNLNILKEMSNQILNGYKQDTEIPNLPERIFVWRSGSWRNLRKQDQLALRLSRMGFVIIDPVTMTFESQVMYFNKAKTIVGVSGAAWANLIFCNPSVRVVSIRSELMAPWDMHERIAESFGLRYESYNVKPKGKTFKKQAIQYRNAIHEDLELTANSIEKITEFALG